MPLLTKAVPNPPSSDYYTIAADAFSQEGLSSVYTTYLLVVRYREEEGVLTVPVDGDSTSTGNTIEAVQIGPRVLYKTVEWETEKIDGFPLIPDFTPPTANEVLVRAEVNPVAARQGANGQRVWRCSGCYTYTLRKPTAVKEGWRVGKTAIDGYSGTPLLGPTNFIPLL